MTPINPINVTYFDSFAAELMSKFQRLRYLVQNNATSGNYHEEILRSVLKKFLSKRYSVKTGFIYKDDRNISNQMDIIIIDENSPATYIFQEGDFAIVIPEAVVAFIEVKTTIDTTEFDNALRNIASAKRLMEKPINHPGIIFGYQSSLKRKNSQTRMSNEKLNHWFKRDSTKALTNPVGKMRGPDLITWLNDNLSVIRFNIGGSLEGAKLPYRSMQNPDGELGWQISLLLATIVAACETAESIRTNATVIKLSRYFVAMKALTISDHIFRFREDAQHSPLQL